MQFTYIPAVKGNEETRLAFNQLAQSTFSLCFEEWHAKGYWQENYIPYTLFDHKTAIANVSVNVLDVIVLGNEKRYIQLGTVMTHIDYRNHGLVRYLMNKVLDEWTDKCDAIFLFANDTVKDFYPKFGFVPANEYVNTMHALPQLTTLRKLDMQCVKDIALLKKCYDYHNPFAALTCTDNFSLLMFYCGFFMKECVYYIPSYDAAVIMDDDIIYDIYCPSHIALANIINTLYACECDVTLGFSLKATHNTQSLHLRQTEDETLFVYSDKDNVFAESALMIPLLFHA